MPSASKCDLGMASNCERIVFSLNTILSRLKLNWSEHIESCFLLPHYSGLALLPFPPSLRSSQWKTSRHLPLLSWVSSNVVSSILSNYFFANVVLVAKSPWISLPSICQSTLSLLSYSQLLHPRYVASVPRSERFNRIAFPAHRPAARVATSIRS